MAISPLLLGVNDRAGRRCDERGGWGHVVRLVQLLFTPLLATWSIWVGLGFSARSSDIRVAQQLGVLASLPPVFVTALIALNVIHATLGLALGLGAALLLGHGLGWRIMAATFDREQLVTGTRS